MAGPGWFDPAAGWSTYLFMRAFPPLLPYAFEASGIASTLETPLTGTWMVVRVVFVAFLWRTTFWQGHRPFLIGAGLAGTWGLVWLWGLDSCQGRLCLGCSSDSF